MIAVGAFREGLHLREYSEELRTKHLHIAMEQALKEIVKVDGEKEKNAQIEELIVNLRNSDWTYDGYMDALINFTLKGKNGGSKTKESEL